MHTTNVTDGQTPRRVIGHVMHSVAWQKLVDLCESYRKKIKVARFMPYIADL